MFTGDLFRTTADWYTYNRNRENSLILVYEEMKTDLRGNIKKVSDFLGKNLSDNVIDIIAEKTTFSNMSKDPNLNYTGVPVFKEERSKFLRKGKVGDWREYFSDRQNQYIETKSRAFFDPIRLYYDSYIKF